ncbi:DegV family protein [Mollicutes bacterium LVI A0039]|nr:DegV family protein [Mollicutes bacterium LVI A0039]
MKKIGIVVSSPVSKTELIKNSDLILGEVLLSLYIDEVEYNSHTITQEELFKRMRDEDVMPTTAQPSPGEISLVIEEALRQCEKLIMVMPHESLSGTYQNVVAVVNDCERKDDIFVLASNSVAISEAADVEEAIKLITDGESFESVCEKLVEFNNRLITYAYPGSTRHLRKSGRISNSQALLLGALNIRVQIKCDGDAPYSAAKGRGEKFVLKNIEAELANVEVEHIYYVSLSESEKLRAAVFAMFERNGYPYTETDPADAVPCVHFGENTLGFTVVCK